MKMSKMSPKYIALVLKQNNKQQFVNNYSLLR